MSVKTRIGYWVGMVLLCLLLTGCGFGSTTKKKCLPCTSSRRSAYQAKRLTVFQVVMRPDGLFEARLEFSS